MMRSSSCHLFPPPAPNSAGLEGPGFHISSNFLGDANAAGLGTLVVIDTECSLELMSWGSMPALALSSYSPWPREAHVLSFPV